MGNKEHRLIAKMTGVAIFAALSFVLTAFCMIPYPGGVGYFNFGDIVDILASFLFGPLEGMLVGMIGGVTSDLLLGGAFALWTLFAKGLLGLSSGFFFVLLRKRKILRFLGGLLGAALEVLVYMLAYYVMEGYGGLYQSAFDCLQAFGSFAVAIPIYLLLEKTGIPKSLET
jgi:uncharacterized membrane protein